MQRPSEVDNILCISENSGSTINKLKKKFPIRNETVESPKKYLGADIKEWQLPDGRLCWSMSSEQYVKNAVKNVKEILKNEDRMLKTKASMPLPQRYCRVS